MKKSDLYRERARVLDMCEGTDINPNDCCKYDGNLFDSNSKPSFNFDPKLYEFAVAILEDRPVFVGDALYAKSTGESLVVSDSTLFLKDLSWDPPKKTFILNGVELPCPIYKFCEPKGFRFNSKNCLQIGGVTHHFASEDDAGYVLKSISKILTENTK